VSTLDEFVERRRHGAELLERLADEVARVEGSDAHARQLRSVAARARDGRFVVLLLGCFSSGKSTLLNALLGRQVLPVKVNPCTPILTEVTWGEAPSVQVRHSDGSADTLTLEEFTAVYQLRTASNEEAGAEVNDRFGDVDRATVTYPLRLLRNGVVLLDTPGLDDDERRTARTLSSLPDADAVIVVLSATRFLTEIERRTVRRDLLPLGLTNLFFPVTMVDLLDAVSDHPERDLADLHRRGREVLGPLCRDGDRDRFDERFFPLDARGALLSRYDRATDTLRDPPDEARLAASALPAFEASLERFLVDERGRAQLEHLVATVHRIRGELARRAEVDLATASASIDELRQRQEDLEPQFDLLRAIGKRVGRTVDRFVERQQALIWQDLRDFMVDTEDRLPEAVAEFDLGSVAGLDLLTPQGRARVEDRLRAELEGWLEDRITQWQATLRPRLEVSLADLRTELAADAADFDALSYRIVTDFAGHSFRLPGRDGDDEPMSPLERWFSVAAGAVLLSPGAMAAGWSDGYEGMLKGLASRIGVRLAILTLGALLGPVGWAGVALYVASDAVLLVLTGGGKLRRLRQEVADRLRGQLVAQADAARPEVTAQVAAGFGPLRDALVQAAQADAEELRELLDQTVEARARAAADAAARAEQWQRVLAVFDGALAELA
jgi:hypothetical protein